MKRVSPILLSMAGCLLLFSQKSPSPAVLEQSIKDLSPVGGVPASVTKDLVAARKQVLQQQDVVRGATEMAPHCLRSGRRRLSWRLVRRRRQSCRSRLRQPVRQAPWRRRRRART